MYVSKALQKAKIEVNEDGTKASAATSEYSCSDTLPPESLLLIISPDMFFIKSLLQLPFYWPDLLPPG